MGASGTATVGQLVGHLQNVTVANGDATRNVVFSVDNGQMKVSHTGGGEAANDFTISLAFNDNDGTASTTFTSPTVLQRVLHHSVVPQQRLTQVRLHQRPLQVSRRRHFNSMR